MGMQLSRPGSVKEEACAKFKFRALLLKKKCTLNKNLTTFLTEILNFYYIDHNFTIVYIFYLKIDSLPDECFI